MRPSSSPSLLLSSLRCHQSPLLLVVILLSLISSIIAASQLPLTSKSPTSSSFSIISLARTIDLGGASSRESSVYTLQRQQDGDHFIVAVDEDEVASNEDIGVTSESFSNRKLSWMDATVGKTSASRKAVAINGLGFDSQRHAHLYLIDIPPSNEKEVTVTINTIHVHPSVPKPAYIAQGDTAQGLYWEGDLLGGAGALDTKFEEGSVKVRVKTATPRSNEDLVPEGWSAAHPAGSATIVFTNTKPISSGKATAAVHYDHPEPIISITILHRTAQISHWGNHLSIQDDLSILNRGPKLKGHFSRLTHQSLAYMRRNGQATPHTLTTMAMALPPNIFSPYYIDDVGNVSTSKFRPSPKVTQVPRKTLAASQLSLLELVPRYPLLGGWNYTFSIGYKYPLGDVLKYSKSEERYTLAIPFMTPLKGVATDRVELDVILPEGASEITVSPPFPVDTPNHSVSYTYLDTSGRPTVHLIKNACTERHALEVFISYKYTSTNLVKKPLVIAGAMMSLFLIGAALRRVRWSFI